MALRTFGQLLREERKRRHWSQAQLAEKVDTDIKTISRWETGSTFPSPHYQERLLSALGKDLLAELNRRTLLLSSHLPARNLFFTGREELLKRIRLFLSEGKTTVALSGLGGMGKTHVAAEYAYRYQEDYHYILWATADSQSALALACRHIAETLNLPEMHEQDQQRLMGVVKQWLHEHRDWLLILDNVEDPNLVDDFRPRLAQGHLLITTQDAYVFEHTLQIPPMNQEEGSDFLFARRGMALEQDKQEKSEQAATAELVNQMEGLPLALDQAAAYMRTAQCGVAHYLHLYQTRRKELLSTRGRPAFGHSASLVATISLAYEKAQATPGVREVVEFCAFLHPDQIPEEVLREDEQSPFNRLIDPDHFLLAEALRELLRYSLVSRHPETETISMHRLVQVVLRDLIEAQKRRDHAERVIAVLSHTLSATDSLNWLGSKRYLLHAQYCATWIEEYQIESEEAYELLRATGHLLQEQAQYSDAERLYQRASNILSSKEEPDPFKEAQQVYDNAVLSLNKGQYEQSEVLLQQALAMLNKLYEPAHPILVMAHNTLAEIYSAQGRYTEAQRLFLSTLKMREILYEKDHPLIAKTCHCLAMNYMSQGEYREAEHFFQRALQIRKRAFGESHPFVAETLHDLAMLYAKQGFIEHVPDLIEQALVTREQTLGREHVTVAEDLQGQALLHRAKKNYGEAEALLQQAVTIQEQRLGAEHPDLADSFHMLGELYCDQSRFPEAEQFLQRALKLRQKSLGPQHSNLVQSFIALGLLYKQQRRWREANWHFHQALRIVQARLQTESSVQDWKWYAFLLGIMSSPEEE